MSAGGRTALGGMGRRRAVPDPADDGAVRWRGGRVGTSVSPALAAVAAGELRQRLRGASGEHGPGGALLPGAGSPRPGPALLLDRPGPGFLRTAPAAGMGRARVRRQCQ